MGNFNLWTRDEFEGLSIQGLPGGAKIILWEGYITRRRSIWEIRLVYPKTALAMAHYEVLEEVRTYAEAKDFAEAYVAKHFELWLLTLHKLRPPLLGTEILHPEDEKPLIRGGNNEEG